MEQGKYDVFISYSRKDYVDSQGNVIPGNVISKITSTFNKFGISYWIDEEGELTGKRFAHIIASKIDECRIFLFVCTHNSVNSEWVDRELSAAVAKHKDIIPFACDDSFNDNKVIMFTSALDRIEYYKNPKKAMEKLVVTIEKYKKITEQEPQEEIRLSSVSTPSSSQSKLFKKALIPIALLLLLGLGIYWMFRPSATQLYQQGMLLYDEGKEEESFPLLLKSARMGYDSAQYIAADMYNRGKGIEKNDTEAMKWLREAAKQGHGIAQYELAEDMLNDAFYGGEGSLEEAVGLYQASAAQGTADAQNKLSALYTQGFGVEKNDTIAFNLRKQAAMQGHPVAQYALGLMYEGGIGTKEDVAQAIIWYRASAEQGYARAQNMIGEYYMGYHGGTIDNENALFWLMKSAKQGNDTALYNIGNIYAQLDQWAEAIEYYQKAAEKENADAMYQLGFMYWYGLSPLPENKPDGMRLLRKAAEKDCSKAMVQIGKIYEYGLGGYAKNTETARNWYEKAAKLGNEEAQMLLQQMNDISDEVLIDP